MDTSTSTPPWTPASNGAPAQRSEAVAGEIGAPPRLVRPPGRRVRRGRLALAVALVVLCAAGLALAFAKAGHKTAVLVVARPVAAGHTIAAADIRVAQVSAGGLSLISSADAGRVVGRVAAVDLQPGTNLTPAEITGSPIPAAGQTVTGVLLKPGALPGRGLSPGDRVQVVVTSSGGTSSAGAAPAGGAAVTATVVDVTAALAAGDGSQVVDLLVRDQDATAVATNAAAGRIALILLPRSGG